MPEHKSLKGSSLHIPFNTGLEANTNSAPAVGDFYFTTDTSKIWGCAVAGTWLNVGGIAIGTVSDLEADIAVLQGTQAILFSTSAVLWSTQASLVSSAAQLASSSAMLFSTQGSLISSVSSLQGTAKLFSTGSLQFIIDGGGSVIPTGIKGTLEIPFDMVLSSAFLLGGQTGTGSAIIGLWTAPFGTQPVATGSIHAAAPLTLSNGFALNDITLTGWTKTLIKGSMLRYDLTSLSSFTFLNVGLRFRRT